MSIYYISMPATGTFSAYVKAESPEEAIQKANDLFSDRDVSLCWHCSQKLDTPVIGPTEKEAEATLCDDDDADAAEFFHEWGNDDDESEGETP